VTTIGNVFRRIGQCEHCEYPRAARRWCPRCSSIDPFPKRRRLLYGVLALVLVGGGFAIVKLSPAAARSEVSKAAAQTKSFTAPRPERSATGR